METNGNQKTAATVAQRRLFYPDGPFVSEIGFGAWPIGGAFGEVERQKGIETVQAAVKLGVTFIDTADYYENAPTYGSKTNHQGGSETVIGLALKNDPTLEGFVTTKVSMPPHTAERIHIKCGESLRNLQLDTIPLYQLHFYDESTPIQERMGALKTLQEEGLIQFIGLNNTTVEQLEEAWATGVRIHTLQIRYSMFSRRYVEAHILPWCAVRGVGILAHSVLGKGLLSGRYQPGHMFADNDERSNFVDFHGEKFERFCHAVSQLELVADRKGATMTELATGWVLRRPEISVALVGGKSPEQVEANTRYVNDFSEKDLAEIGDILEDAPEISWEITNGGADTPLNNDARIKAGLPTL
jgi:aryl-alcohol dehydrogenase-like predicted oxidoreductase